MRVTLCDRCARRVGNLADVRLELYEVQADTPLDLCQKCNNDLRAWFNRENEGENE